ncbi:hypothetical protein ACJX0J_013495, partial [Zea mays]
NVYTIANNKLKHIMKEFQIENPVALLAQDSGYIFSTLTVAIVPNVNVVSGFHIAVAGVVPKLYLYLTLFGHIFMNLKEIDLIIFITIKEGQDCVYAKEITYVLANTLMLIVQSSGFNLNAISKKQNITGIQLRIGGLKTTILKDGHFNKKCYTTLRLSFIPTMDGLIFSSKTAVKGAMFSTAYV